MSEKEIDNSAVSLANQMQSAKPCFGESVEPYLEQMYGEQKYAMGIDAAGNLRINYANLENGTWTNVSVSPQGLQCVEATGTHFMVEPGFLQPVGQDILHSPSKEELGGLAPVASSPVREALSGMKR